MTDLPENNTTVGEDSPATDADNAKKEVSNLLHGTAIAVESTINNIERVSKEEFAEISALLREATAKIRGKL